MATVSIITINYNNADGLKATMHSVAGQSLVPFEHIIVDGGSADASRTVISAEERDFTRSISETDNGIYDAQNKGIDIAKGDYLLFLNSGDILADSQVLEKIAPHLGNEDLVFGDMRTHSENEPAIVRHMHSTINSKVLYADTIWHPVSFFRKHLFDNFGKYNTRYRIAADYEFYCRILLQHHCTYKHVPIVISDFDTSGISSSSANRTALENERREIQDKYFNPFLLAIYRFYSRIRK